MIRNGYDSVWQVTCCYDPLHHQKTVQTLSAISDHSVVVMGAWLKIRPNSEANKILVLVLETRA